MGRTRRECRALCRDEPGCPQRPRRYTSTTEEGHQVLKEIGNILRRSRRLPLHWTNSGSDQAAANARLYITFEHEKPFIHGNSARRSAALCAQTIRSVAVSVQVIAATSAQTAAESSRETTSTAVEDVGISGRERDGRPGRAPWGSCQTGMLLRGRASRCQPCRAGAERRLSPRRCR